MKKILGTGRKKYEIISTFITYSLTLSIFIVIFFTHIEKLGHRSYYFVIPLLIHLMILEQFGFYKGLTKGK